MTGFKRLTVFRIVRQLALYGPASPLIYLLVVEASELENAINELSQEVEVQIGVATRVLRVSERELASFEGTLDSKDAGRLIILVLDADVSGVAIALDANIARVEKAGWKLLIVADSAGTEELLKVAPHLRSRFAEIVEVGNSL